MTKRRPGWKRSKRSLPTWYRVETRLSEKRSMAHPITFLTTATAFSARPGPLAAIASEDGKVAFLVIVLEAVAVGIELAAIFAKLFGFNPTTYAAIVARDYFVRISRMADAMEDELANDAADSAHVDPAEEPANDNLFGDESQHASERQFPA